MDERLQLWSKLESWEGTALKQVTADLAPLEPSVAMLHDLANALFEVPRERKTDLQLLATGGLMKRALDDLRAMWLLLNRGYTAAAGACAADLWEHAMLASWAAIDPLAEQRFRQDEHNDKGLSALKLAKAVAALIVVGTDDEGSPEATEILALEMYGGYQMLCQLKHPSLRALAHTSKTSVGPNGTLWVTASPDSSPEDLHLKQLIIVIVNGVIDRALQHLAVALKIDEQSSEGRDWLRWQTESGATLRQNVDLTKMVLPFTIGDSYTAKRLRELEASRVARAPA